MNSKIITVLEEIKKEATDKERWFGAGFFVGFFIGVVVTILGFIL